MDMAGHRDPGPAPPRAGWRDRLARVAAEQDGLVTSAQLRAIGVPSSTASGRARAEGGWTRVLPGVHLVTGGRPDRPQRERAALLYAGPQSLLGGPTALRRMGVRWGRLQEEPDDHHRPAPVHVLVPHAHHLQSVGFVVVSRTRRWPEGQAADGLRMAPAARAVVDATRGAMPEPSVDSLVDEVVRRGLTSPEELMAEVSRGPRQGSARLRAVLERRLLSARDGVGLLVEALLDEAGMEAALWGPILVGPAGEPVGRPMAWLDAGVALEPLPSDAAGVVRLQRYAALGVTAFPVSAQLLRSDPRGQARALAAAWRHAASRARPAVRALVDHSSPARASGLSTPQEMSSSASLLTGSS